MGCGRAAGGARPVRRPGVRCGPGRLGDGLRPGCPSAAQRRNRATARSSLARCCWLSLGAPVITTPAAAPDHPPAGFEFAGRATSQTAGRAALILTSGHGVLAGGQVVVERERPQACASTHVTAPVRR
ncbi:hypothetical protein HBB16_05320 [Pseudonocardia sp. MCCB 268]|nr:hypothetical protein [Pseudonocardia cytotoxica]